MSRKQCSENLTIMTKPAIDVLVQAAAFSKKLRQLDDLVKQATKCSTGVGCENLDAEKALVTLASELHSKEASIVAQERELRTVPIAAICPVHCGSCGSSARLLCRDHACVLTPIAASNLTSELIL